MAALCSRPIARLDKVWKRVHGDALRIVQSWVYPLESGEGAEKEPTCIPWAGTSLAEAKELLHSAQLSESSEWKMSPLLHALSLFESVRRDFDLHRGTPQTEAAQHNDDVETLVRHWRSAFSRKGGDVGVAAKFKRCVAFVSLMPIT